MEDLLKVISGRFSKGTHAAVKKVINCLGEICGGILRDILSNLRGISSAMHRQFC